MTPLTAAVLKSGIISPSMLAEFKRWKAPIDVPEEMPDKPPQSIEEAAEAIEKALQSEGYAITRETDLEILPQYLSTQQNGTLHMEIYTDDPTVESMADIPIVFGRTPLGEYIIPWKSESIALELTNGACYLGTTEGNVAIQTVRELFYGEHKAFMVCTGEFQAPQVDQIGEGDGSHDS
jgi:hypothetical protein